MLEPEVLECIDIKVAEAWAESMYPGLTVFSGRKLLEIKIRDDARIFVSIIDHPHGCLVELYQYQYHGKGMPMSAVGEPVARTANTYRAMASAVKELMALA